ncbi:MAG: AEC family transporter [Bacillota bacterium]|nr:AEC family transporter [Bacillota bacterium]
MMLFQVVLPVFLIFLVGYIGQKILSLHIKSISTAALYLITPALIFRNFYTTALDATYLYMLIYVVLLSSILIIVIKGVAFLKGYDQSQLSALILAAAFMNNGNFGAPIMLFAYGELAFQYSIAIMIIHVLLMSTLGVYYAAKGNFNPKDSLYSVLKMPILHALFLGLLWQYLNLPMPANIYNAIDLVADAAIPIIMLVLGMQLAEIKLLKVQWGITSIGLIIRLLISPAIAYGLTLILPVEPLLAKVMIVLGAMPSAAFTVLYAIQYDSSPELVSSITFISTILSLLTLSILLTIL